VGKHKNTNAHFSSLGCCLSYGSHLVLQAPSSNYPSLMPGNLLLKKSAQVLSVPQSKQQPSFVIQKFLALHSAIRTPVPVPLFIYFICLISFHFVSFHLVSCLTYAVSVRKDWLDFFAYSFPSFVLKDQPKQQSASNFGHRNSPKRPRNFRH